MRSFETSGRARLLGWLVIAGAWVAALAAGELLARHYGGFVIVDGRLETAEPHAEGGEPSLQNLGGVTVWRRAHPDRPRPAAVKRGYRIVVLGDSILLPALLPDRDGALRLLENELNARLDDGPYEVVNLAEGGWNVVQEEQVFLHEALPLDPDLVLVGVSPNDTQEFAYRDGQLWLVRFLRELEERSRRGLCGYLASHSYLYNLIWLRWEGLEVALHRTREREEEKLIVAPLRRMKARSAEHGARLALFCFPALRGDRFDVEEDRCSFRDLVEWTRQERVPLLDPVAVYSEYAVPDLRLDHIHLSRLGHRVLARATFDWLVAHRLVPYGRVLPRAPDSP